MTQVSKGIVTIIFPEILPVFFYLKKVHRCKRPINMNNPYFKSYFIIGAIKNVTNNKPFNRTITETKNIFYQFHMLCTLL